MAARAAFLGDTGQSAPEYWDGPFGTDPGGLHALLVLFAADEATRQREQAWHAEILRDVPAQCCGQCGELASAHVLDDEDLDVEDVLISQEDLAAAVGGGG